MKLRLFMLPAMAGLLFAGSVFAACGGDDDDEDNDARATNTRDRDRDEDEDEDTPTRERDDDDDDATATPEDDDDGGDGSLSGSGADDLRDLASDLSEKEYSITYTVEGNSEDLDFTQMTIIQKPPKTATIIESADGTFSIIDDGEFSYLCSDDGNGEGSCLQSESSGDSGLGGALSLDTILDDLDEDVEVERVDDREVAGRDAQCFNVVSAGEEALICFDEEDGLMLYTEGESEGETIIMEATDVSTDVDDSVFEPPYEVVSLEGLEGTPTATP